MKTFNEEKITHNALILLENGQNTKLPLIRKLGFGTFSEILFLVFHASHFYAPKNSTLNPSEGYPLNITSNDYSDNQISSVV